MLSGMASTMAQGFAFGTGSSIAHRYLSFHTFVVQRVFCNSQTSCDFFLYFYFFMPCRIPDLFGTPTRSTNQGNYLRLGLIRELQTCLGVFSLLDLVSSRVFRHLWWGDTCRDCRSLGVVKR